MNSWANALLTGARAAACGALLPAFPGVRGLGLKGSGLRAPPELVPLVVSAGLVGMHLTSRSL